MRHASLVILPLALSLASACDPATPPDSRDAGADSDATTTRDVGSGGHVDTGSPSDAGRFEPVCVDADDANVSTAFSPVTGRLELAFEVTPTALPLDAAVGLSDGANSGGIGFAAAVRFGVDGVIDARDGDRYAAASAIDYDAGTTYRVRLVADVAARTYDAWVAVGDGAEQPLATGYAFRSEFSAVDQLDHWIVGANQGALSACLTAFEGEQDDNNPNNDNNTNNDDNARTLVLDTLKAFPTAYGGGAVTAGGRGGVVVLVNTLDYDAPLVRVPADGALEEHWVGGVEAAIEADIGPRYIVFDVSGTIDADLPVTYDRDDPRYESRWGSGVFRDAPNEGFISILGQTAPEGGVTLYHSWIQMIRQQEILIRHLRVRTQLLRGSGYPIKDDTVTTPFNIGSRNVILDHVTASHGGDKGLIVGDWGSGYPMLNITVQWSMVLDSATSMFSVDGVDGGAGDWDTADNVSWLYNLAMSSHRTPNTGGGFEQLNFDVQNNVVQGDGSRLGNVVYGRPRVNYLNNYYDVTNGSIIQNKVQNQSTTVALIHASGNYYRNDGGVVLEGLAGEDNAVIFGDFYDSNPLSSSAFTSQNMYGEVPNPAPVATAVEARAFVLADAGANRSVRDDGARVTYRDSYDAAAVDRFEARRPYDKDWSGYTPPAIPENTRPAGYYQTVIGIPEWFVQRHGITDKDEVILDWDFGDYEVANQAGYPAIEVYAAWAAGDFEALLDPRVEP